MRGVKELLFSYVSMRFIAIEKLADVFEKSVKTLENQDMFENMSYSEEAQGIYGLAGKLHYKAEKEKNQDKAMKLKNIARTLLAISDGLRSL